MSASHLLHRLNLRYVVCCYPALGICSQDIIRLIINILYYSGTCHGGAKLSKTFIYMSYFFISS